MFKFDEYRVDSIDLVYDADGCGPVGAVCAQVSVWDRPEFDKPLINKRTVWVCVDDSAVSAWAECPMSGFNKSQSYWVEISQYFDNQAFNQKLIDGTCVYPVDNIFDPDCGMESINFYPIWHKLYQVLTQPGFGWIA